MQRLYENFVAEHLRENRQMAMLVDADCFAHTAPVRVPATTLLSQLV